MLPPSWFLQSVLSMHLTRLRRWNSGWWGARSFPDLCVMLWKGWGVGPNAEPGLAGLRAWRFAPWHADSPFSGSLLNMSPYERHKMLLSRGHSLFKVWCLAFMCHHKQDLFEMQGKYFRNSRKGVKGIFYVL